MTKTQRWAAITAVICVVILAAGWILMVKPQNKKVSDLKEQAAEQVSANQLLVTQISQLQSEQKQLPQLQKIEDKFAIEVPDSAAEPTLIRQLSSAAHGSGIDLTTITPGAPAAIGGSAPAATQSLGAAAPSSTQLYQLPLTLAITGTYSNIESFFNSLERLPRSTLVTQFSLAPGGGDDTSAANTLSASLTATTFFAPGSAPITIPVAPTPTPATSTAPPAAGTQPGATTTPASTAPAAPSTSPNTLS